MKNLSAKCEEIRNRIESMGENHIPDGIVKLEKYLKAPHRILWVLKDPNSEHPGWSMTGYLSINDIEKKRHKENDTLKYRMYVKVLITSYGILNNFPEYEEVINKLNSVEVYGVGEQIAYINIKKAIGGSSVQHQLLAEAYNQNRELLLEQIDSYKPTIIIFGNTLSFFQSDLKTIGWDFNEAKVHKSEKYPSFPDFYKFDDGRILVFAYHPACRKSYKYYYEAIVEGIKTAL